MLYTKYILKLIYNMKYLFKFHLYLLDRKKKKMYNNVKINIKNFEYKIFIYVYFKEVEQRKNGKKSFIYI